MDKELWDKCQMLVDAGMGHLVKHLYVEELENRLTQEQLQRLGDISSLVDHMLNSSTNAMKQTIEAMIYMSKKGAVRGVHNQ